MRALITILFAASACGGETPTPTETVCPDPNPLTYDNFVQQFMTDYCISCHDSSLPRSQRNGAPLFHDFDTLQGVVVVTGHIDEQAGSGPAADNHFMPPSQCPEQAGGPLAIDCPTPSEDERKKLSQWLACCDPVAPNCM